MTKTEREKLKKAVDFLTRGNEVVSAEMNQYTSYWDCGMELLLELLNSKGRPRKKRGGEEE